MITALGAAIEPQVLLSSQPRLEDSVADILARAPARFALVGTSYGGNVAMEVALAAPERVTALWLMGCSPAAPQVGGPDLAGGMAATPDTVFDMLARLVPVTVGESLATALPHARFEVLPGCGHLPTLEKPAESAAMFTRLLETAEAGAI